MKNVIALFAAASCLFLSSCHRPVAYFQRTPHPAATRLPVEEFNEPKSAAADVEGVNEKVVEQTNAPVVLVSAPVNPAVASQTSKSAQTAGSRIEHRMHRMQSLLSTPKAPLADQQPGPKPKKKLKLGNQIRQSLGMKLRPELNWWQRISWKLKASVLVILIAVVFAILHITILAIIFGLLGAFLLISGLKRSFKVRRPWF